MATLQNKQTVRKPIAGPFSAGVMHVAVFDYTYTVSTVAADIIELGVLPAGCRIHTVSFTSANIGLTGTVDVGFMTGNFGDLTATRTMAATGEIINDGAKNGTIVVTAETLAAIASTDEHRGIGVKWTADETAGGTETLRLIMTYYAD